MLPDGRFQAIVRDIRARREAENALRTNEEMFRKIFDSGVSGIAVGTTDVEAHPSEQDFRPHAGI